MNGTEEIVWERRECVSADVEGSLVLLDLDTLVYHSLNRTASAVWEALQVPSAISVIATRLQDRFEVDPVHCERSVSRLIAELAEKRLVSRHAAPSA